MHTEGPLLILAGAGSGKTTVLVSRIAYIIENNHVPPYNILAITFTNKAANEMKRRIEYQIGASANDMWIGTFHSVCVRMLRGCIDKLGYGRDFIIYDSADSRTLMKECLKELDLDEKNFPVRAVLSIISNAKNNMLGPEEYFAQNQKDYRLSRIAQVYSLYQQRLVKNNALDFDDIIFNTVKILEQDEDTLKRYQSRFKYILVDEYQDTNNMQYKLIRLLAGGYENICVVGDDDQSIYKFRGANINNILGFKDDYDDVKIIKLEQNYRSSQNILDAANAVIENNRERTGKKLWTDNGGGEKIKAYTGTNEYDEGRYIAKTIRDMYRDGRKFSDFAILYRTNAQSRVIEEMLMRESVPYRVLAGLRFYDRKEIKDIIAYLRIIYNHDDNISLKRIINEPKRTIGNTTVEKAQTIADFEDTSIFKIISRADEYPELSRAAKKLMEFTALINDITKLKDTMSLTDFVSRVMNDTGYMAMLTLEDTVESRTRIENLNEFMSAVKDYEDEAGEDADLGSFLESISLVSDIDMYDEDLDSVVMMTIHSAKGLEFPVVFLTGLEEGLFPGQRSMNTNEDIEEERRLCYVAITRAKEELYITKTISRTIFGRTHPSSPSRFYKEIPSEYLEEIENAGYNAILKRLTSFNQPKEKIKKYEMYDVKKSSEKNSSSADYKVGERVRHRKFGEGTIISVQKFGSDAKLEIDFNSVGVKQLMAVFAKLEKI